jgi:hypothetical protein
MGNRSFCTQLIYLRRKFILLRSVTKFRYLVERRVVSFRAKRAQKRHFFLMGQSRVWQEKTRVCYGGKYNYTQRGHNLDFLGRCPRLY